MVTHIFKTMCLFVTAPNSKLLVEREQKKKKKCFNFLIKHSSYLINFNKIIKNKIIYLKTVYPNLMSKHR